MADLSVQLAGVTLRAPVIAASGTCGYIDELADAVDLSRFGAVVTKSITREPRQGNATWRILDAPHGMLNAIGLANMGLERFLAEIVPRIPAAPTTVIGSIAGGSIDDYVTVAAAFDQCGAFRLVELNVSCPNTADGLVFGENPAALGELLRAVRPALSRTRMLVKLSPNVGDIVALARAAIDAGADGLTLINTVSAMAIDVETRAPRLSNVTGGYSGPAIHPIAVRMIHAVYRGAAREAGIPIIGLGGVMTWRDAAQFILAGASAVGMGTALFVNPRLPLKVMRGLDAWVTRQGGSKLSDLVGQVDPGAGRAA
ncbi:MAG: dihydroorotate dehydrogenase [Phycisphaeraceae bacterium]|nr:dihydroorotate dehydrogenase [Phycisphaerales bacterium]QOJ17971.1 MAG: dihydroorotate dehydrogenase [Phycisphaeraceae bacterium]